MAVAIRDIDACPMHDRPRLGSAIVVARNALRCQGNACEMQCCLAKLQGLDSHSGRHWLLLSEDPSDNGLQTAESEGQPEPEHQIDVTRGTYNLWPVMDTA